MPLATTHRTGLVDQVIEQMRQAISSGEWPVGQRIPAEPDLVGALGVGRNTVREAVRALAHAGVLEVRQGDGTFVRATSELSGAVRRLVGDELREVLQVRRALEVEGSRLAALRRTPEELHRLEALLTERDTASARQNSAVRHDPGGADAGRPSATAMRGHSPYPKDLISSGFVRCELAGCLAVGGFLGLDVMADVTL